MTITVVRNNQLPKYSFLYLKQLGQKGYRELSYQHGELFPPHSITFYPFCISQLVHTATSTVVSKIERPKLSAKLSLSLSVPSLLFLLFL